jgi:hypothetical protein
MAAVSVLHAVMPKSRQMMSTAGMNSFLSVFIDVSFFVFDIHYFIHIRLVCQLFLCIKIQKIKKM